MDNAYLVYRISNGEVVNAIVYDGEQPYDPGEGMALVLLGNSGAWIGWTYDPETETFTAPPEPEEQPA
jgi:hypothetical protein